MTVILDQEPASYDIPPGQSVFDFLADLGYRLDGELARKWSHCTCGLPRCTYWALGHSLAADCWYSFRVFEGCCAGRKLHQGRGRVQAPYARMAVHELEAAWQAEQLEMADQYLIDNPDSEHGKAAQNAALYSLMLLSLADAAKN